MQPRLKRSATESMVAGVSGGLAEYFNIDPVIVRLIFVLVTLTSGLGVPVYLLLWIIMPKEEGAASKGLHGQRGLQFGDEALQQGQQRSGEESRVEREVLVGQRPSQAQARGGAIPVEPAPSAEYRFDPVTGEPLGHDTAKTGRTVNLNLPPTDLPAQYRPAGPRRSRSWNTLGIILIGIGALVFLEQFGIDMSLIFPALLIVAGVILIRRKR